MMLFPHFLEQPGRQQFLHRLFGEVLDVLVLGDHKAFSIGVGTIDGAVHLEDYGAVLEEFVGVGGGIRNWLGRQTGPACQKAGRGLASAS